MLQSTDLKKLGNKEGPKGACVNLLQKVKPNNHCRWMETGKWSGWKGELDDGNQVWEGKGGKKLEVTIKVSGAGGISLRPIGDMWWERVRWIYGDYFRWESYQMRIERLKWSSPVSRQEFQWNKGAINPLIKPSIQNLPCLQDVWDKDIAETGGMAKQWLAQMETHPMRGTRTITENDTLLCFIQKTSMESPERLY